MPIVLRPVSSRASCNTCSLRAAVLPVSVSLERLFLPISSSVEVSGKAPIVCVCFVVSFAILAQVVSLPTPFFPSSPSSSPSFGPCLPSSQPIVARHCKLASFLHSVKVPWLERDLVDLWPSVVPFASFRLRRQQFLLCLKTAPLMTVRGKAEAKDDARSFSQSAAVVVRRDKNQCLPRIPRQLFMNIHMQT